MLNMDFSKRVVINTEQLDWKESPVAGVSRKPRREKRLNVDMPPVLFAMKPVPNSLHMIIR